MAKVVGWECPAAAQRIRDLHPDPAQSVGSGGAVRHPLLDHSIPLPARGAGVGSCAARVRSSTRAGMRACGRGARLRWAPHTIRLLHVLLGGVVGGDLVVQLCGRRARVVSAQLLYGTGTAVTRCRGQLVMQRTYRQAVPAHPQLPQGWRKALTGLSNGRREHEVADSFLRRRGDFDAAARPAPPRCLASVAGGRRAA